MDCEYCRIRPVTMVILPLCNKDINLAPLPEPPLVAPFRYGDKTTYACTECVEIMDHITIGYRQGQE